MGILIPRVVGGGEAFVSWIRETEEFPWLDFVHVVWDGLDIV